jgi:hypothetical protein
MVVVNIELHLLVTADAAPAILSLKQLQILLPAQAILAPQPIPECSSFLAPALGESPTPI